MIAIPIIIVLLIAFVLLFGLTSMHFHQKPKKDEIRIACVGDSITNGALLPACFFRAYPAKLQRKLGYKYHVENNGLNSRTVQRSADRPYWVEKEYKRCMAFQPDIVTILLGTNDAKEINWVSKEAFDAEYRAFLDTFLALPKKPAVILCAPPWQRNAENKFQKITNDTRLEVFDDMCEIITQIGKDYSLTVVDLFHPFVNRTDLLRYDGVHPRSNGAQVIADMIYEAIINVK